MVTKPDFLKVGGIVKVQHWYGEIVEVAVSDRRIMVLVKSPKGIWRNHPAEWLEYDESQITPAALDEAVSSIDVYQERVERMLAEIEALRESWRSAAGPILQVQISADRM